MEVRFAEVTLSPTQRNSSGAPVKVWAVYVTERDEEEEIEPVEWMLLTTVPVETFKDAQKRVEWYSGRWGIEMYHRTLKSGCRIETRQLGTAERLEAVSYTHLDVYKRQCIIFGSFAFTRGLGRALQHTSCVGGNLC